ncbi:MAG: DNA polymerase III subunit alpha, partial [Candidatus Eisenbacteria bacterium]|nr:DNA polymerase III subunit alpha [Candidatus Eisenbacteria bacterium]
MQQSFVHLHVHSDYSLLTGATKIKPLVARAAELNMDAVALTDNGNLFGAIEFYDAARSRGLKPIVGMETYLTRSSRFEKDTRARNLDRLVLLARNHTGFKNLLKIATAGYLEGFYYLPRIDYEFLEDHAEGLIGISSGMNGAVAREVLAGQPRQALDIAGRHREILGDNFYVALQDHNIPHQRALIPQLVDASKRAGVRAVAVNDVYYLGPGHASAQEVLVNIRQQNTMEDKNRFRAETDQRYFKSTEEMAALFEGVPDALQATRDIADLVELNLDFGNLLLPEFPLPTRFKDLDDYLVFLCEEGLKERYSSIDDALVERLKYELDVIRQMGYAGYFLITRDFIQHARDKGISVGPGRGSAAGSLVAYCLRITDIDPMRFELLFERFLNPERVSMPDIDIDFDYRRRGEVIEYVKQKYGEESVTQIITFGTMAARGVIRDVGRVLGMDYSEVDYTAKLVPAELGISLEKAVEQVPELSAMEENDGVHGKLIRTARTLEGVNRHASTHAAGVLIAPGRLDEVVPLFKSGKGEVSTQWDMKSSERVGLLKMDFLGLRTLTVINDSLDLIEERTGNRPDLENLGFDDEKTFDLLRNAHTIAVFQLESSGMRDLLRKLSPESFEDIVAVNALYRPGPMGSGMVNDFIDCKHGHKEIRYEHPCLEPILKSTYGMMVYQEQVMQIASTMAGFSLGDADILRRAMGKKKKEEMDA